MLPHVAMIAATLMWASSIPAGKLGIAAMPASELLVFRFGIGALLLWAFIWVRGRRLPFPAAWRACAIGAIAPAFATMLAYWALYLTSAIHVVIINALMPLFSALFAWGMLRERTSAPVVAGSLVALGGVVVLAAGSTSESTASLWGDLLVIGCNLAACYAIVSLRRLGQMYADTISITAWQMVGAALASLFVMTAFESWIDPRGWTAVEGWETWGVILYLAVFVSALSFAFNNYALRHVPTARVTLYFVLTAPLGVPLAAAILGEPVTANQILALVLVTAGVALPALYPLLGRIRRGPGDGSASARRP